MNFSWRRVVRRAAFGTIVALACSAQVVPDRPDSPSPGASEFGCGTLALATMLKLEGKATPPGKVAAGLPTRPEHSLAEIRVAADRFGVHLSGVRLSRRDWPIDRPALAHLDRDGIGHFVVIRPVGASGRLVQLIDPIFGAEVREADAFFASNQWKGAVLIPHRWADDLRSQSMLGGGALLACCAGFLLVRRIMTTQSRGRRRSAQPVPQA